MSAIDGRPYATRADGIVTLSGTPVGLLAAEATILRTNVVARWGSNIRTAAAATDPKLPWWWVAGVIYAESAGNSKAFRTEPTGQTGVGLMQLTDPGLKAGHSDAELLDDPILNLRIGTQFLARLRRNGNTELPEVASAYNCGPDAHGLAKKASNRWGLCEANGYLERVVGGANTALLDSRKSAPLANAGGGSSLGVAMAAAVVGFGLLKMLSGRR